MGMRVMNSLGMLMMLLTTKISKKITNKPYRYYG
jgi:hypothetical protein